MIVSRPDGSVSGTVRSRSTNRRKIPFSATHRHGWLLCTDGAREASCTASLSVWMSSIAFMNVNPCRVPVLPSTLGDAQACDLGSFVATGMAIGPCGFLLPTLLSAWSGGVPIQLTAHTAQCPVRVIALFGDVD